MLREISLSIIAAAILVGCSSETKEERAARECKSSLGAWAVSQRFVRSYLKAPGSADFDSLPIASELISGCTHRVVGEFEAQNAFGVMSRHRYSVTMTYDPEKNTWSGSELNIQ